MTTHADVVPRKTTKQGLLVKQATGPGRAEYYTRQLAGNITRLE